MAKDQDLSKSMVAKLDQKLFLLEPDYRERVWGGQRLKAADPPVGEAWIAFDESRVRAGANSGRSVAELASLHGAEFLGMRVWERCGPRFPLLVKLLDCADWLSVQVHPNDEQARRMAGPEESGKTEAWHFLEVEPGATILAGVKPGTSKESLKAAIRSGNILEVAKEIEVSAGETYLLPAGTLHALGPGLLLYEVQQASDITYRVYDWDRPATAGRKLHVEESVAVTDPQEEPLLTPPPSIEGTSAARAVTCPYFELDVLRVEPDQSLKGRAEGGAFEVLTMTEGVVEVRCEGETVVLKRFETVLVAGSAKGYEIHTKGGTAATLLRATLPAS